MGMRKWDHIEEILKMDRVQTAWKETYNRHSNKTDVDELYYLLTSVVELERLLEAFGASNIQQVEDFISQIYQQYGLDYQLSDYGLEEKDVATAIINHCTSPVHVIKN